MQLTLIGVQAKSLAPKSASEMKMAAAVAEATTVRPNFMPRN